MSMRQKIVLGLLILLLLVPRGAWADDRPPPPQGEGEWAPSLGEGERVSPPAPPEGELAPLPEREEEGPPPGGRPGPLERLLGPVVQHVVHVMRFPIDSMTRALNTALSNILRGTFDGLSDLYASTMHSVAFGEYAWGPSMDMVRPIWTQVLGVAVVLWPLVLALNVLVAARGGVVGGALGYADLKESILEWIGACVMAAISLYVLDWGIRLSNAISFSLMPSDPGSICYGIAHALADVSLINVIGMMVPGGMIFLGVFFLTLGFALIVGFMLAFIARYVMLFVLISLAPLALTLGAVPPTRWLSWLWAKGVTLALLVGPANAILLNLAFRGSASGAPIVRFVIVLGIISILIGINYTLIQAVFGAVAGIAQRAARTAREIVTMALLAAGGIALGAMAVGGAGAAAKAAPSAQAAEGGALPTGGGSPSPGGTGGAPAQLAGQAGGSFGERVRQSLSDPLVQQRLGRVMSGIGRGAAIASHSPGIRAVGALAGAAGDLMTVTAGQSLAARGNSFSQDRDRGNRENDRDPNEQALVRWGIRQDEPALKEMARVNARLADTYGTGLVRKYAPPIAQMMGAASARGLSLEGMARDAGFSSVGAWYGNMVEELLMAATGRVDPLFPPGSGLQTPTSWSPGALTAYDYIRGMQLAQYFDRANAHPDAYAEMIHALRSPQVGMEWDQIQQIARISLVNHSGDVVAARGEFAAFVETAIQGLTLGELVRSELGFLKGG